MIKIYESPDLEVVKFTISTSILSISEGEDGKSSGFIENPDGDMEG